MKNRVVAFHYELKNQAGEVLDSSAGGEPLSFVEGQQQIIPGLEEQLKSMAKGDKKKVTVAAAKAYGTYDKALKMTIPADKFPQDEKIEVGDQFRMRMDNDEARIFTVTGITKTEVMVDGNHPLAGQDLFFDVEITSTREATKEDLQHQHGPGCSHDHEGHKH